MRVRTLICLAIAGAALTGCGGIADYVITENDVPIDAGAGAFADASSTRDAGDGGSGDAGHGVLDPTFGIGGVVNTALGLGDFHDSWANAIAIRDDGVIDVAAADDNRIAIAQYLLNGALDPGFADGEGVLVLGNFVDHWTIGGIGIAPDDSIRFVGTQVSQAMVGSVTSTGFPDTSFADGGIAVMPAAPNTFHTGDAMHLDADGILFAGGQSTGLGGTPASFAAWRTSLTGVIDLSFGSSGASLVPALSNATYAILTSVARQSTGGIVALGYAFDGTTDTTTIELVRFTSTGALDTTFSTAGIVTFSSGEYPESIAIQDDDAIVLVGENAKGVALWRCLPNGAVDMNFGDAGEVSLSCPTVGCLGRAVLVQSDGKIVSTGSTRPQTNDEMFVARILTDGSLDTSFGSGGMFIAQGDNGSDGMAIARARDGRLVVAGMIHSVSGHIGIWRLLP